MHLLKLQSRPFFQQLLCTKICLHKSSLHPLKMGLNLCKLGAFQEIQTALMKFVRLATPVSFRRRKDYLSIANSSRKLHYDR